ncbi:MAG: ATP-binding protein [Candidatus Eremiobacterota bacterium]
MNNKQLIIAIAGLPGCGKSTVASRLSKKLNLPVINTDVIRERLFFGEDPLKNTPENRKLIYKTLFIIADCMASSHVGVILDGTFPYEIYRSPIRNIAGKCKIPCYFIECFCPEDFLKERIEKRKESFAESAGWDVYLRIKESFEPFTGDRYRIDTSMDIDGQIEKIFSESIF